jgi:hypothetical protein
MNAFRFLELSRRRAVIKHYVNLYTKPLLCAATRVYPPGMQPVPLCPNCIQPMRLTRRISGDASHRGQDVYECAACRVAMTQAAQTERQPGHAH